MALYENSRYLKTPVYNRYEGTGAILKHRQRFQFDLEKCTMYEWVERDTLGGVAFKHYGASALRWAILDANPKYRTEYHIKAGDIIMIPDYEEVVEIVNV